MSTQKIAKFMQERRSRCIPVVMTGEVIEAIGSEGMNEALNRRWLIANPETGYLQITTDMARVNEIAEAAGREDVETRVEESAAAPFAVAHATRRIDEIAAPATGKPAPTMGGGSPTPPPVNAPTPTTRTADAGPNVGDDVAVAQEGRTYTGKVASRSPEGRYTLSFGPERPAVQREYAANELRIGGI